jgi:hypothetical protein
LSFCIQFFRQCVSIALQCVLAFAIERKIVVMNDACSRPHIIIRFHDLHAGDIRKVVGEIIFYHERDKLSPSFFFGSCKLFIFWPFFGLPFLSPLRWF